MLKIEVIKFEAMDVITASTPAPDVDAPVEDKPAEVVCTCNPDPEGGEAYYACFDNNHPGCPLESNKWGDHNCPQRVN